MRTDSRAGVVALAITMAACGSPQPSPRPAQQDAPPAAPPRAQAPAPPVTAADERLAAEVARFLDAWIVKRAPGTAVAGNASVVFGDRRFVPAAAQSPAEYRANASGAAESAAPAAISADAFESALQAQLTSALGDDAQARPEGASPAATASLGALTVPLSPETVRAGNAELWELIGPREPRALQIDGVPSLAYRVRAWPDISWTASATIGFRFAMARIIEQKGVDLEAVVTQLKPRGEASGPSLVVTLWSDEGSGGAQWRLVGVELPAAR